MKKFKFRADITAVTVVIFIVCIVLVSVVLMQFRTVEQTDITEIESKSLDSYFIEFRAYIKNCEFIGCTHIKENNCGIKNALEEGKILQTRYNNFCKIYNKLKEMEERKW